MKVFGNDVKAPRSGNVMAAVMRRDAPAKINMRWFILLGTVLLGLAAWKIVPMVSTTNQQTDVVQPAPVPGVRVATARTGPIAATLLYTGDVKATSQVNVVPKASGRVEKLLVDVGTQVKQGDVIAQIDSAVPQAQVGQAQAALEAAQAKYENMKAGARAEQVAQARAAMDSAQERVSLMEEGTRDEQVAQAEASLEAAKAKARQVQKGAKDTEVVQAQAAVDAARAQLQSAQAKLQDVKNGPKESDWGKANAAVDQARAQMKAAEERLADVKAGPKEADIAAAEAAVLNAKAQVAAANDLHDLVDNGNPALAAAKWSAGATSNEKVGRQAAAAQAALDAAEEKLKLLRTMPLAADLQAAQSAYDAAKAQYQAALSVVNQMKASPTAEDIGQVDGAVKAAQANVAATEAKLKLVRDGATAEELEMVQATVDQAELAYAIAQQPFREQELNQARNAVAAAQAQYNLALNPYTKWEMEMGLASVHQAEAAVDLAQVGLTETTIVSPIDGVVSDRFQVVGNLVGPPTPLVSIVTGDVELALPVEESKIGQVKVGQKAEVKVVAYPDKPFPAKVTVIAPSADAKSRTFLVKVKPEDPEGNLMQGMFAEVKILTREKQDAIVIPKEAVLTRDGKTSVFVLKDDAVQLRQVKLGISSASTVEIESGISAGEEIVTAGQNDIKDGDKVNRL